MSKTAVVFSCSHSDPSTPNDRFSWLGNLIYDLSPDLVIDLGDGADMRSLNSFDTRYPSKIISQSYQEDINHYLDAQERLRHKFRKNKRKLPTWIGFEGNHEHRIKKVIQHDPRLEGDKYGVSFKHLETDKWFNEYHEYSNSAPTIANYDGVSYAHYFSAGSYGRAISGRTHAASLISHRASSSTCGHSHKRDISFKDNAYPNPIIGLVVGCYKQSEEDWAGQANNEWWSGVVVKRNIESGCYDPEFISLESLRKEYESSN